MGRRKKVAGLTKRKTSNRVIERAMVSERLIIRHDTVTRLTSSRSLCEFWVLGSMPRKVDTGGGGGGGIKNRT